VLTIGFRVNTAHLPNQRDPTAPRARHRRTGRRGRFGSSASAHPESPSADRWRRAPGDSGFVRRMASCPRRTSWAVRRQRPAGAFARTASEPNLSDLRRRMRPLCAVGPSMQMRRSSSKVRFVNGLEGSCRNSLQEPRSVGPRWFGRCAAVHSAEAPVGERTAPGRGGPVMRCRYGFTWMAVTRSRSTLRVSSSPSFRSARVMAVPFAALMVAWSATR
jgi:hypothetical protein